MFNRPGITFCGLIAALSLNACNTTPHNDVLIFGTDTSVGVDVGANATSGGTPQISIGYQRKEAVWMPLLANARHASDKQNSGSLYEGQSSGSTDAYSVFASFGAELEGSAGSAKVGLAQFFATGIAAQKMADNPSSVLALTVKGDAQGQADAEAVEKAALAKDFGFKEDLGTAQSLDSCLTDRTKAAKIKTDPTLSPFDTGLPDAAAANQFQKIIATDRNLLNRTVELCTN